MERSAPLPRAQWNQNRDCWEEPFVVDLLCGLSAVYSEIWPDSGSMRSGQIYELPMSEHPICDAASSWLLGTPRATLGGSSTENLARLLPTPMTDPSAGNGHARTLSQELREMTE